MLRVNRVFPAVLSVAALFATATLIACSGVTDSAPTANTASTEAIATPFGMHVHDPVNHWPTVPFTWWRMWDSGVSWTEIQPTSGSINFSRLDTYVDIAEKHDVKIIYVLGNTPQWATNSTRSGTQGFPGATSPPNDMNVWRNFVSAVVTRYKGRIAAYEVWNEVNLDGYWTGSTSQMVQMTQIAYETIKGIDSNAQVLAPSLVAHDGFDYLTNFMNAGGNKFSDGIPFHLYTDRPVPEEAIADFYQPAMAASQRWGKPIWDTEVGWGPFGSFDTVQSAAFLSRTLILQAAIGITHIVWYAWDDHGPWVHLFVSESDNQTPTLAGQAFKNVTSWLTGNNTKCNSDANNIWTCTVMTSSGTKHIVWNGNSTSDTQFTIPSDWSKNRVTDVSGNQKSVSGGQITINSLPVLVE